MASKLKERLAGANAPQTSQECHDHEDTDSDALAKLALLNALRTPQDDEDDKLYVSSMKDAHLLLQQHMSPSGAKYRKTLVEHITDPDNKVLGEGHTYHEFVMDLLRVGDYNLALQICDFALGQAPYNRDMLADAIRACGSSSQFEKGTRYLERARAIPRNKWSARLFLYSVDFLKTKVEAYPLDDALYKEAMEAADEYIQQFPFDEHGYNQKAELLITMNQREQAVAELRRYIFEIQPDEKDNTLVLVAAQCCVTLLRLLDDSTDYDFIIQVCDKGVLYTAQNQPPEKVGFFIYRKALALDAKARAENLEIPATVSRALTCYQAAYDVTQDSPYGDTIEARYAVLRPYAQDFQPLVKRRLYTLEADNRSDADE